DPKVLSFSASSQEIEAGEVTTLSWRTSGASGIEIFDQLGNPVALGAANPAEGEVEVGPIATTRYELIAKAENGKIDRASTTVTVRDASDPAIVTFEATPSDIAVGGAATLSWQTTNADEIALFDGAGAQLPLGDAAAEEGQVEVEPSATTTYRLEA